MFYDINDGPTREQLHAELDRILDQGQAKRDEDGWPELPKDLISDLWNLYVAIGDAAAQRDIDKHSPLQIIVSDRTKARLPGAWVEAPPSVSDLASALRNLDAARTLTGIAHELQKDAAFFFDSPARFKKMIVESDLLPMPEERKIPNAATRAAIEEARSKRGERD